MHCSPSVRRRQGDDRAVGVFQDKRSCWWWNKMKIGKQALAFAMFSGPGMCQLKLEWPETCLPKRSYQTVPSGCVPSQCGKVCIMMTMMPTGSWKAEIWRFPANWDFWPKVFHQSGRGTELCKVIPIYTQDVKVYDHEVYLYLSLGLGFKWWLWCRAVHCYHSFLSCHW